MAGTNLPTPEDLRNLLDYDPETGALTWKPRGDGLEWWDAKYAGKPALTATDTSGYFRGAVNCVRLQAHRVAWAIATGSWPPEQIDHINGNKRDNRLRNLRPVSADENQLNQKRPKSNTSGFIGVTWDSRRGKWKAKIGRGHKTLNLGRFDTAEAAYAARKEAEFKHGFHENHGRP